MPHGYTVNPWHNEPAEDTPLGKIRLDGEQERIKTALDNLAADFATSAALQSPNSHYHQITVGDDGRLTTNDLGSVVPPHGPPPYATLGEFQDTSDPDLTDSIVIPSGTKKRRRVPIADKMYYTLGEFYDGSAQPADVIGPIHDMLKKTKEGGGSGGIPDSQEPWEISEPIVPYVNSRMHGPPGSGRFSERYSNSHDATKGYTLPALPNHIGEAWIKLKNGSNCPILMNDYNNVDGKRGPDRGNGAFWQWFTAERICFDHNGRNQTMSSLGAIYFEDAWGMELVQCRLVAPRYRGLVLSNCNSCNGEKFSVAGESEWIANGTGVLNGTNTVTGATGTWAQGETITGTNILSGTYLTGVSGSAGNLTLTMSAAATGSGTVALSRLNYIADALMVLEDSTVDSEWIGCSAHASKNGLLLDTCYGNRISGLFGYSIGGHNVWLRETMTGSPNFNVGNKSNRIDVRADQATKHNIRIDDGCVENLIDVTGIGCGIFNTPADSDGGWCTVFCDGQRNVVRGTGNKSAGPVGNMSAVAAAGPNASDNDLSNMTGGSDLGSGTPIWKFVGTNTLHTSNRMPGPPPFFVWAKQFEAVDGSTAALVNYNGTLHKVLSFADGVTDSAIAYITIPYGIKKIQVRCQLLNIANTPANPVRIQMGYAGWPVAGGNTPGADEQVLGPSTISIPQSTVITQTSFSGAQFNVEPGEIVALRFKRIGADSEDQFAGALGLLGVRVDPLMVA
jgi:hypothetical protein